MNEISTEVYESILDDIEAAVIELGKGMNEIRIQQAWEVGKVIRGSDVAPTILVKRLATEPRMKHIKMGERSLWKAVEIFDMEPENWEKLLSTKLGVSATVNKLLALGEPEKPECVHEVVESVHRCASCKKILHETNKNTES